MKLHFKEILHYHIKHTYRTVIFLNIFTKHKKSVQPFQFCCSLAYTELSKKLSNKQDSLQQCKGWHQPNFVTQTNTLQTWSAKFNWWDSDLKTETRSGSQLDWFSLCSSPQGTTLPISHRKGYASKPLFMKKMPFKQIHHKAKEKKKRERVKQFGPEKSLFYNVYTPYIHIYRYITI